MNEETPAPAEYCANCGKKLGPKDEAAAGTGLCMDCAVTAAQLGEAEVVEQRMPEEDRRELLKRTTLAALVLLVAGAVFAYPYLFPPSAEQPDRIGTTNTDASADECIENISVLMDASGSVDLQELVEDLKCPATGNAYVVTKDDDGAVTRVECPNPAEHGLTAIYMQKGASAPTVEE